MNRNGLEQNVQPTDLAETLSYTSQSLVISYNMEWVEVKGHFIWRDIEKAVALMCSR